MKIGYQRNPIPSLRQTIPVFALLAGLLLASCGTTETLPPPPPRDIDTPVERAYGFDEDAAVNRLSQAIQFATVSVEDTTLIDYSIYDDFIEFVKESYPLMNEQLELTILGGHSMLYKWEGSNPDLKPALFIGHYDVVPAEESSRALWTYPPFSGEVSDGFVWGRGALDDKGGLMSVVEAFEHLLAQGYEPERTFYVGLNHDEEIGGLSGAASIARYLEEQGEQLEFLVDEGLPIAEEIIEGIDFPLAMIGVAKKGAVNIELYYRHEGGHSSMPPRLSVVSVLGRALTSISDNPMPGTYSGLIRQTFEPVIPYMSWSQRLAFNNPWLFKGLIERRLSDNPATNAALRTTAGKTIFEAGVKENVLPTEGRAVINFRIHPNDTVDDVVRYVRRTIDNEDVEIRVMPRMRNPSPVSSTNARPYRILQQTIEENFERAVVVPSLFVAGSDSRHFHNLTSNMYRFRPIRASHDDRSRVHGIDERIRVYNYLEMIHFHMELIKNTSGRL